MLILNKKLIRESINWEHAVSILQYVCTTEKKQEIPLPSHWEPMKGEKVKLVNLKPDSAEYKKVAAHFGGRGQAAVKKVCGVNSISYAV